MKNLKFRIPVKNDSGKITFIEYSASTKSYTSQIEIGSGSWLEPELFSGHCFKSGRECFEGDISFVEIEESFGDVRIYYVCTFIEEYGWFCQLNTGEYLEYLNVGVDSLDSVMQNTYTMEGTSKHTYAGNIHENFDLVENGGKVC